MRTTYYRQCLLLKGEVRQTAWIPEQFAVTGNFIRLDEDGSLWTVSTVSERSFVRFQEVIAFDYLGHRHKEPVPEEED